MSEQNRKKEWKRMKRKSDKELQEQDSESFISYIAEAAIPPSSHQKSCVSEGESSAVENVDNYCEEICDTVTKSDSLQVERDFSEEALSNVVGTSDMSLNSLQQYDQDDVMHASENEYDSEFEYDCEYLNEADFERALEKQKLLSSFEKNKGSEDCSEESLKSVDEESEDNDNAKLLSELTLWSIKHHIGRNALTDLLHILNSNGHPNLPLSSKTLLKTPRNAKSVIKTIGDGLFWYGGIINALKPILKKDYLATLKENILKISVFTDGLSPYKSVKRVLWPICVSPAGTNDVFVVALWCGEKKEPGDVHAYFENFVEEAMELKKGFLVENVEYKLLINNVIADAPARAWIRMVNQHGSYYSCERCTVRGQWFGSRMTYKVDDSDDGDEEDEDHAQVRLRTDESLFVQEQEQYHKGVCPLLPLEIKLLTQFPLEPMHLVYLGIMKRFLSFLLSKTKSRDKRYKLPDQLLNELSNYCKCLATFFSSDFARKPRSFNELSLFKATEFRRILLYDGLVIFRKIPYPEIYKLFLLLSCGIRLLTDPEFVMDYADDAHQILKVFVKESFNIFGQTFVVYNVHHLPYLPNDCKLHGPLEMFSAFKFENFLGEFQYLLHAPGRTLPQIICRLIERASHYQTKTDIQSDVVQLSELHCNGPLLDLKGKQYRKLSAKNCMLRLSSLGDSFCLTKFQEVVKVQNIVEDDNGVIFLVGKCFLVKKSAFEYPFDSAILGIYEAHELSELRKWRLTSVKRKMVVLPLDTCDVKDWSIQKYVCIPLCHIM